MKIEEFVKSHTLFKQFVKIKITQKSKALLLVAPVADHLAKPKGNDCVYVCLYTISVVHPGKTTTKKDTQVFTCTDAEIERIKIIGISLVSPEFTGQL